MNIISGNVQLHVAVEKYVCVCMSVGVDNVTTNYFYLSSGTFVRAFSVSYMK